MSTRLCGQEHHTGLMALRPKCELTGDSIGYVELDDVNTVNKAISVSISSFRKLRARRTTNGHSSREPLSWASLSLSNSPRLSVTVRAKRPRNSPRKLRKWHGVVSVVRVNH